MNTQMMSRMRILFSTIPAALEKTPRKKYTEGLDILNTIRKKTKI